MGSKFAPKKKLDDTANDTQFIVPEGGVGKQSLPVPCGLCYLHPVTQTLDEKMPRTLKRLLISVIALVCSYYALRFTASVQITKSFASCVTEQAVPAGKKRFENEEEARAYANQLFDCMDKRHGFIARLFFDKQEASRNLAYTE
jgi:hypothetical protein